MVNLKKKLYVRFKNPEPADSWDEIRQADSFGNVCPQLDQGNIIGDEDCLFLNVYTPLLEFNSTTVKNFYIKKF